MVFIYLFFLFLCIFKKFILDKTLMLPNDDNAANADQFFEKKELNKNNAKQRAIYVVPEKNCKHQSVDNTGIIIFLILTKFIYYLFFYFKMSY